MKKTKKQRWSLKIEFSSREDAVKALKLMAVIFDFDDNSWIIQNESLQANKK